jgi:hypothetical protein
MIESITSNPSSSYNGSVSPQPHALGSNQAIGHTIAQQLNRAYSTGTDQGQLLHGFLSGLSDSVAQHLDKVNQELQRKRDANDLSETPEGIYYSILSTVNLTDVPFSAHNLVPPQKRIKSFDSGISACGHAGAQETGRSEQNQQSTPSVCK